MQIAGALPEDAPDPRLTVSGPVVDPHLDSYPKRRASPSSSHLAGVSEPDCALTLQLATRLIILSP